MMVNIVYIGGGGGRGGVKVYNFKVIDLIIVSDKLKMLIHNGYFFICSSCRLFFFLQCEKLSGLSQCLKKVTRKHKFESLL